MQLILEILRICYYYIVKIVHFSTFSTFNEIHLFINLNEGIKIIILIKLITLIILTNILKSV